MKRLNIEVDTMRKVKNILRCWNHSVNFRDIKTAVNVHISVKYHLYKHTKLFVYIKIHKNKTY